MRRSNMFIAALWTLCACKIGGHQPPSPGIADSGARSPRDAGSHMVPDATIATAPPPSPAHAVPTSDAVAPSVAVEAKAVDAPADFGSAPSFSAPIKYVARQGNVLLYVPKLDAAGDYRAFVMSSDVSVKADGDAERVLGATITCAGLRQNNQCDPDEAITTYGPNIRVPKCSEDSRAAVVKKSLLPLIQLDGLVGKATVVVEAIDGLCPFPGAYGAHHHDIECSYDDAPVQEASYQGKSVQWRMCPATFPVRSEAEIRADYGSLVINGQAPAATIEGHSPWEAIGLPAADRNSRVLARATIEVEPRDPNELPAGFSSDDFFESFSDSSDAPQAVTGAGRLIPTNFDVADPHLFQTRKLSLYSYGVEDPQWFIAQGTMRAVLADWGQGIMGSNVMYPKRAFQLPQDDTHFIHATFEAVTDSGERRYWWFHACGAEQPGQTIIDGRLAPQSGIVAQPGFMNPLEGISISTKGWNCLQIVPRGGTYDPLPGGPYTQPRGGRPETDLRIVINKAVPDLRDPKTSTGTIVNVSPPMIPDSDPSLDGTWLRQWDASQKITGVLLDDQIYVDQRVTFDVFFNRGRIVVFANGVQKLCNDFPKHRLSMAEAAVGLGQVLYHSSAERGGFLRDDWLRTGQFQYLHNTPFLDQRSFDNFGVKENAALPDGFVEGQCYESSQ